MTIIDIEGQVKGTSKPKRSECRYEVLVDSKEMAS